MAWISVDTDMINLRRALENTLIVRLRPPINAQVGTNDISIRQQWFQKFKRDGYCPDFIGYTKHNGHKGGRPRKAGK